MSVYVDGAILRGRRCLTGQELLEEEDRIQVRAK